MTVTLAEWRHKARKLADELSMSGDLITRQWHDAVSSVPRHALVPYYYTQKDDSTWKVAASAGERGAWLDTVYSDTTLITALASSPGGSGQIAVSSSTMPGLMVRMLEALDVDDGHRVLEIGTGTGYNAGLLSHRLGSEYVFSVDVDRALVSVARERLTGIGYTPILVARDGYHGLAEYASFDRIISTCAVPAIPRAWIEQTAEGGLILTDFKLSGMAGNLVLLQRHGDTATGRFLPSWAGFMDMRHANHATTGRYPCRDHANARVRRTSAPLYPWLHTVPWFLAQFNMPHNLTFGQSVNDTTGGVGHTFLSATDGSWCEVDVEEDENGARSVAEGGPTALWERFEEAYEQWQAAGEPDWPRFGLTVTPERHTVWLDEPHRTMSWSLTV